MGKDSFFEGDSKARSIEYIMIEGKIVLVLFLAFDISLQKTGTQVQVRVA